MVSLLEKELPWLLKHLVFISIFNASRYGSCFIKINLKCTVQVESRCETENERTWGFTWLLCLLECVCKEVEITQLMCYFAVRHINCTKTCDQASKQLLYLWGGGAKHQIISQLYSLFFKYIVYLEMFLGGLFFLPKAWPVQKPSLICPMVGQLWLWNEQCIQASTRNISWLFLSVSIWK